MNVFSNEDVSQLKTENFQPKHYNLKNLRSLQHIIFNTNKY